jgi:hypothetical protein
VLLDEEPVIDYDPFLPPESRCLMNPTSIVGDFEIETYGMWAAS